MKIRGFFRLFSCLILFISLPSVADKSIQCPKKIAITTRSPLVEATLETFKKLYFQLGCSPQFLEVPGRRGILYFNEKFVDGEFFRFSLVEERYSRAFVRSAVPLFQISNSLWLHPDEEKRDRLPIGYVLGVVWQEEYMKDRHGVSFSNSKKLFDYYQKGRLSGFLASNNPTLAQLGDGKLQTPPIQGKLISKLSLYHYLGIEHADFMEKLSELLIRNNPFEHKQKKEQP